MAMTWLAHKCLTTAASTARALRARSSLANSRQQLIDLRHPVLSGFGLGSQVAVRSLSKLPVLADGPLERAPFLFRVKDFEAVGVNCRIGHGLSLHRSPARTKSRSTLIKSKLTHYRSVTALALKSSPAVGDDSLTARCLRPPPGASATPRE
ncbi:protein of unknown function [Methylorubrum extorquens]|uniref:Uncharacterized protein n=1 Tax=Methylorubrum extorquens TaxID=408 RepID=A0A2N9AJT9_METEX|nr:protein of unknown function [Methylorubrum extorquens]